MTPPVRAIIWDFDNTLVDTGARNLSVTRSIVTHITGRDADDFPMLRGRAPYERALHANQNWQDLYAEQFGLAPDDIRRAGRLWTEFQLADPTPTSWFPGVADTIRRLGRFPQGIVSLNTRDNIEANLDRASMGHAFDSVVGCGEVPYDRQKPNPDGLMACVGSLIGSLEGTIIYIGDHAVDSECARNAARAYSRDGRAIRVVSVAASYGNVVDQAPWPVEAHHRVREPERILAIVDSIAS